jgi:hypothetical protein
MNDDLVKKISIHGVFEDPQETENYLDCSNKPCFDYDQPYPISSAMIEIMKDMILKSNFKIITNAMTDSSGDGEHNLKQNIEQ